MTSELVLWFGSIERSDRKAIEKMVRMVPALSADLLESCDVGLWLRPPSLRVRLQLRNAARTPTVALRISAWAARARGVALAPAAAAARADRALESADLSELGVAPPELPRILDRAFSELAKAMAARSLAPVRPSHCRQNVHYDARRRELFLPSDLTVPVGRRVVLAV